MTATDGQGQPKDQTPLIAGLPARRGLPLGSRALIIVMPWLIFTTLLCLFVFAYHKFAPVVWIFVATCIIMGVTTLIHGQRRKRPVREDNRKLHLLLLGVLILQATLLAVVVGLYVYNDVAQDFWLVEELRTYNNVRPDEDSRSRADAGTIIFSKEARVATESAAGFNNGNGFSHCVAPIMGPSDHAVQYWAVGENCCKQRGSFTCPHVGDPEAHSAVAVRGSDAGEYAQAATAAATTFELEVAPKPLFVRWVKDPEVWKEKIQEEMVLFTGAAVLGHLVLSIFPVCLVRS